MSKRRSKKPPKTDIIDAALQDIELTTVQAGEKLKKAAESAGRALTTVVTPKDNEPGGGQLMPDPRYDLPPKTSKNR
jgi:hypothetical protein